MGTPLTGETEERSAPCGRLCSRWKDLTVVRVKKRPGAVTPVLDLAKAFEGVGLPVVWAWATQFHFHTQFLSVMRALRASEARAV